MAKRRFTFLDGLLILLALAVIAAAVWYFTRDAAPEQTALYTVTLRIDQATENEADYYQPGDTMYFQNRTAVLGTVKTVEAIEKTYEEYDPVGGRYVEIVDPEWNRLMMTVEVQGGLVDGEFIVNGESLYIGQVFYPQSDTTRSIATVWDIEEVAA